METIFKQISEMSSNEKINLDMFYMDVCEQPMSLLIPNYNGRETACVKSDGRNLADGKIIGSLLFYETKLSPKERSYVEAMPVFLITRIDVYEKFRRKGIGTELFEDAIKFIPKNYKRPLLIKIEKITLFDVPKKFGFEDFGDRFAYYKIFG